ncbi:MADS box transcription factor MEF2, partial [Catenaria anguillulae PL171]
RRTQIARIGDERLRRSALLKRRHGLYKKATELATLCDCQVAILIFDSNDRLHHYS